jgi:hypothetical protein
MFWQSQNLIINKWFPANEYGLASALVSATSVTMVFGFMVSGFFFSNPERNTIDSLNGLIWFSNVIVTAIFLLFQLTFKYSPDRPPSKVATEEPPKRKLFESF